MVSLALSLSLFVVNIPSIQICLCLCDLDLGEKSSLNQRLSTAMQENIETNGPKYQLMKLTEHGHIVPKDVPSLESVHQKPV